MRPRIGDARAKADAFLPQLHERDSAIEAWEGARAGTFGCGGPERPLESDLGHSRIDGDCIAPSAKVALRLDGPRAERLGCL